MFIKVRVFPNFDKEEVIKKSNDSFDIFVKEKPQKGQANKAVIAVLSSFLKIPKEKIRLVKGFAQRNKIFELTG